MTKFICAQAWVTARTPMGTSTGMCLPADISRFTHVSWSTHIVQMNQADIRQIQPWTRPDVLPVMSSLPKLAGTEAEIMLYIGNLSNYVLAAKAMNNLKR